MTNTGPVGRQDQTADMSESRAEAPGSKDRPAEAKLSEGPRTQIGPYTLLDVVGEGGFGTVFLAQQERPVQRKVALKIIKLGMDTRQVVARFEQERQALAILDHPNIAKVFDAGATETGRPYFVMEFCTGEPIDDFCDQHSLSIAERLELFCQVCGAVQHAHTKGLIHRDIKPSNVMVSMREGKPSAKVIDFGIAKATESKLAEMTVFTEQRQMIGTPEYMSPEQADGSLDIDTRTDVYALGVMLYELLTGTTPFSGKELRSAAYGEMQRIIREVEPPKPSTRLSQNPDTMASVAANRHIEPRKLGSMVRGELDWIVMKALEKDRTRRYEAASSLARDVERYLSDDAVEACPPSVSYRTRKFAHKNRKLLATAAGFAALLIVGIMVSAGLAVRAGRAEVKAKQDRDKALVAENAAVADRAKAQRSEEEARSVLKFFEENVLAAPGVEGPFGGKGLDVSLLQAVDAAEPKIGAAFEGKPAVEASVRRVLGSTYLQLGNYPKALRQAERALELKTAELGAENPETARAQVVLGHACLMVEQHQRGFELIEKGLATQTATLGADHADTLGSRVMLAVACGRLLKWQQAIELLEGVVRSPGLDAERVLNAQQQLAFAYMSAGQVKQATELMQEVVATTEARHGPDQLQTVWAGAALGKAYLVAKDYERAIPLLERGVATLSGAYRADHPVVLYERATLAGAYRGAGQVERALELYELVLAGQMAKVGPDNGDTMATEYALFTLYQGRGEYAKAEPILRAFVASQKRVKGDDNKDIAGWLAALGDNLLKQQKWAEAEPPLRESLKLREAQVPDDWKRFSTQGRLGESLLGQQKLAEAEPLLLAGYEGMKQRSEKVPDWDKARVTALERLVRMYEAQGNREEAARWRTELETGGPPGHP